jgi:diguanylate cyclase (GGDEF)-like protein
VVDDKASFVCGALEALLFSLALAHRTLELRRAHEQARLQADIDSLTGLYNRRAWNELVATVNAGSAADAPLSLLFLDLDHFKQLNDRGGHHIGDDALRALSRAIGSELRKTDIAGRYGGEEFVVALAATDSAQALRIAERIRQRLQRHADAGNTATTVSVGVATRLPGEDIPTLLRRSDRAMYAAKRAGRNRVELAKANRRHAEA